MSKIIFFGDSITDSNRNYDVPIGHSEQIGDGYVRIFSAMTFRDFNDKYLVINQGVNGNRVWDLENRLSKDVLSYSPDLVVIMIGINDVWRKYDTHSDSITQISLDDFYISYKKILEKIDKQNITTILLSPFFLELNKNDEMRIELNAYIEKVETLAKEFNLTFVNVQDYMDQFLENHSSYLISNDRVHLNFLGDFLLADYIYKNIKEEL